MDDLMVVRVGFRGVQRRPDGCAHPVVGAEPGRPGGLTLRAKITATDAATIMNVAQVKTLDQVDSDSIPGNLEGTSVTQRMTRRPQRWMPSPEPPRSR